MPPKHEEDAYEFFGELKEFLNMYCPCRSETKAS